MKGSQTELILRLKLGRHNRSGDGLAFESVQLDDSAQCRAVSQSVSQFVRLVGWFSSHTQLTQVFITALSADLDRHPPTHLSARHPLNRLCTVYQSVTFQ